MNVLILNGSAKKNGTVSKILEEIRSNLSESANVELVNVYDLKFKPCLGCMKCRTTNTCILPQDDAHLFAEKINKCDAIIVGTPTYWANMNGLLKMLFDRVVPVFMGESPLGIPQAKQKGKQAVIVTACTSPFPFNIIAGQSSGAIRAVKEVLHSGGFKIMGTICQAGTKNRKDVSESTLRKARQIAKILIRK